MYEDPPRLGESVPVSDPSELTTVAVQLLVDAGDEQGIVSDADINTVIHDVLLPHAAAGTPVGLLRLFAPKPDGDESSAQALRRGLMPPDDWDPNASMLLNLVRSHGMLAWLHRFADHAPRELDLSPLTTGALDANETLLWLHSEWSSTVHALRAHDEDARVEVSDRWSAHAPTPWQFALARTASSAQEGNAPRLSAVADEIPARPPAPLELLRRRVRRSQRVERLKWAVFVAPCETCSAAPGEDCASTVDRDTADRDQWADQWSDDAEAADILVHPPRWDSAVRADPDEVIEAAEEEVAARPQPRQPFGPYTTDRGTERQLRQWADTLRVPNAWNHATAILDGLTYTSQPPSEEAQERMRRQVQRVRDQIDRLSEAVPELGLTREPVDTAPAK